MNIWNNGQDICKIKCGLIINMSRSAINDSTFWESYGTENIWLQQCRYINRDTLEIKNSNEKLIY